MLGFHGRDKQSWQDLWRLSLCASALGCCGWGKACISSLEIIVSPFGNSSLQGSMQSLDGKSTW